MNKDKEIYVLDTSTLMTYIEDEEGSEYVEKVGKLWSIRAGMNH